MKKILFIFASLLLLLSSCNATDEELKIKPTPRLPVNIAENNNGEVSITICFTNILTDQNSFFNGHIMLSAPEQVDQYLKEAEFLVTKLKEAREKMGYKPKVEKKK
jgi:hypothetical protein